MACSDMINQLLNDINSTSKIAQNLQLQLQTELKLQKNKIEDEYESIIKLLVTKRIETITKLDQITIDKVVAISELASKLLAYRKQLNSESINNNHIQIQIITNQLKHIPIISIERNQRYDDIVSFFNQHSIYTVMPFTQLSNNSIDHIPISLSNFNQIAINDCCNDSLKKSNNNKEDIAKNRLIIDNKSKSMISDNHQQQSSLVVSTQADNTTNTVPSLLSRVRLFDMYNNSGAARGIVGKLMFSNLQQKGNQGLLQPIGCTFDEQNRHWIVCDTGRNVVKIFADDGRPLEYIAFDGMRNPSAIVVVDPGNTFAVKDDNSIYVYDSNVGQNVIAIRDSILYRPIGLGIDECNHLVTLSNAYVPGKAVVLMYDLRMNNRPFNQFSLLCQSPKPRFIDVYKQDLAITDLGVNKIFTMKLPNGENLHEYGSVGNFQFVSGIRYDDDMAMLVGDAKSASVQLFNPNGEFNCKIDFDQLVGYVSDLHINRNAHLMTLNSANNGFNVYQLSSK